MPLFGTYEALEREHQRIAQLEAELEKLRASEKLAWRRVTELQERGTELVGENRGLRSELARWRDASANEPIPNRNQDVRRFFAEVSNQEIGTSPRLPTREQLQVLMRVAMEEALEMLEAAGADPDYLPDARYDIDMAIAGIDRERAELVELVDGAIDTMYTAEGVLVSAGVDSHPVWRIVSDNNLLKASGAMVNGKRMKPPGHPKPDIAGELQLQGWEP